VRVVAQRSGAARVVALGENGAIEHEASIERGLVLLVCVEAGDDGAVIDWGADKAARLRIFEDDAGKMNRSLVDVGGGALVVSQFTLAGETSRGNRPSFTGAARPEVAEPLVERFASRLESEHGVAAGRGVFGATMRVELVNEGPVTVLIERRA